MVPSTSSSLTPAARVEVLHGNRAGAGDFNSLMISIHATTTATGAAVRARRCLLRAREARWGLHCGWVLTGEHVASRPGSAWLALSRTCDNQRQASMLDQAASTAALTRSSVTCILSPLGAAWRFPEPLSS